MQKAKMRICLEWCDSAFCLVPFAFGLRLFSSLLGHGRFRVAASAAVRSRRVLEGGLMRLARLVFVCLVLGAALSAAPIARAADISGNWILNFNGPQGPIDATGSFTQAGEDVTGTIDGPQGAI